MNFQYGFKQDPVKPSNPVLHNFQMNSPDFKVLTFDVAGTLIDFETGILNWFQPHLEQLDLEVDEEEILNAFAKTEAHYLKILPKSSFTGLLPVIYSDMMRSWGFSPGEDEGIYFQESVKDWPPFSDTIEALKELKKNFTLVAVSNCDSSYLEWMSSSVGHPFDTMICSDMVGANKPDPRLFTQVLKRLKSQGFKQEEILHVAQSQFHDIVPVSKLGWSSAWIHRRFNRPGFGATPAPYRMVKPTYNLQSLNELVDLLHKQLEDGRQKREGTFSLRVTFNHTEAA